MTDPKRWSDQTDLPPQLRAALRSMAQNTTPPEVVERVQRSLASLPAAGGAGGFPFGWGGAVSTVAVAVAVTATVAWMRVQRDDARAVPAAATVARAVQVESVEPEPENAPGPVTAEAEVVASAVSREPARASGANHEPTPSSVARTPAPRRAVPREPVVQLQAATASTSAAIPVVADAPQEVAEPAVANEAPARPIVPPAVAPEDEASLVYRAKRLARTDRAAAWSLIESHAQHFPNGALVEEREVLAIDVLHRMGREREAKQRAARFLARFPNSGYRGVVVGSEVDPR